MFFPGSRHQQRDGDRFLRYSQYSSSLGDDEILERKAHHSEETGEFERKNQKQGSLNSN